MSPASLLGEPGCLLWLIPVCLALLAALLATPADSDEYLPGFVITYPTPEGEQASKNFSVTVNGQPVFVYNRRRSVCAGPR